jgi:hypothetical protein
MKPAKNYKASYRDCTKQSDEKDRLIVLLQQQGMQLVGERQTLTAVIVGQQTQLSQQAAKMNDQQIVLEQQRLIIAGQSEKLSQQQTIIEQQNNLIATQQQELVKNKKDLLRLDNLRYEMATIKKWVYGIKSEKRHPLTEPGKATIGYQLVLAMEIDSWGVCKINDRRRVGYAHS